MAEKNDALLKQEQAGQITKEIKVGEGGMVLRTVEEAVNFAKWNVESGLLPDHIQNPKQAFAIMARGAEMGLKPHASWRWIYMTKAGKMSMETKGMLAVCQSSPHFAGYREWIENEDQEEAKWVATAVAKRKGGFDDQIKTFSYADAEKANLVQRKKNRRGEWYDGPWQHYLKDMLLARARARALELQFSDVLGGISAKEIMEDVERAEASVKPRQAPSVTVHDPMLDEVGTKAPEEPEEAKDVPEYKGEVKEVIDAQVAEIFPPTEEEIEPDTTGAPPPPKVEVEPSDDPTTQECSGCGVIYFAGSPACPDCGVPSGAEPPPSDEGEAADAEAKSRREKMGVIEGTTTRVRNSNGKKD